MEAHELISDLRRQLNDLEKKGHSAVQVAGLRAYLDVVERDAENSKEHINREHEGMLARYSAQVQQALEMFKAILETGKTALNSIVLINGGAVVALLGVMSAVAASDSGKKLAANLAAALLLFGFGVLCGAVGFASRYFSQVFYAESYRERISGTDEAAAKRTSSREWYGHRFRDLAIVIGISGYILFGVAVVSSYQAVVQTFTP
nr:hypothetical protein 10 [Gammaproteobacteria bacterium]